MNRLVVLGSLYLAQGLPYGFFTQALPVLLRSEGMSLPVIGLANLLTIPWALKFVWAPYIDRRDRRRVILWLQAASSAILTALALAATPGAMGALFAAVLLVNACSATQDIATDGLAVEILAPSERGIANGLQVGAYRVGMILGGGLMLWLFARAGWTFAFLGMAALLVASSVPIARYRPPPSRRAPAAAPWLPTLREALGRLGGGWLLVLATYKTGEWFANGMLRAFLHDAGVTLDELAVMLGTVGFAASLLGALVGGALATVLGRRRALIAFGLLQSLAIAAIALAVRAPSTGAFYAVAIGEHLTSAMATATLFTAMMDTSRPSHAGTDYSVQACAVLVVTGTAAATSGLSAAALGYATHFLVAAGMSLVGVVAVYFSNRNTTS